MAKSDHRGIEHAHNHSIALARFRSLTMKIRTALWRPLLVIAALMLAALACNLQRGELEPTPATSAQVERPTVEILEPASGATLTQGQRFAVKATAKSP